MCTTSYYTSFMIVILWSVDRDSNCENKCVTKTQKPFDIVSIISKEIYLIAFNYGGYDVTFKCILFYLVL